MAEQDRYNDRRYRDQDRNRERPRDEYGPSDEADDRYAGGYGSDYRGEYSYGRPRGDFDRAEDQRRYGESGPVRQENGREYHTPNVREGRGDEARSWFNRASDTLSSWLGDNDARRRHRWDEVRHGADPYANYGSGDYRGRGPRGYRRSDERIREDVNDRLTDDPYLDASLIEVAVEDREVTLAGFIVRREDKRQAEVLAEGVSGVTHVQNNLRLKPDQPEGPAPQAPEPL